MTTSAPGARRRGPDECSRPVARLAIRDRSITSVTNATTRTAREVTGWGGECATATIARGCAWAFADDREADHRRVGLLVAVGAIEPSWCARRTRASA